MAKILDDGGTSSTSTTQTKIDALLEAARAAKVSGNTTLAKKKLAAASTLISKSATDSIGNVKIGRAHV